MVNYLKVYERNKLIVVTGSKETMIVGNRFCDICQLVGTRNDDGSVTRAEFDAKTTEGPWAYLCDEHFRQFGVGLGTGLGQRLVYESSETKEA